MEEDATREGARAEVERLVEKYDRERSTYRDSSYKETPLRNDFLDPLLEALGWDVANESGLPQHRREVVQEETVEGEEGAKRQPDYTLRAGGERRLFVEAKKPSVDVEGGSKPAFQLRRYGWNASLPASVLTNFEHLAVYDCRLRPQEGDDPHRGRWRLFHYTEYLGRFEELHGLLSRGAVYAGRLEELSGAEDAGGTEPFDAFFLDQIESWRLRLAGSIAERNEDVGGEELSFLTQRLINRIVFLRVCEDRRLEVYEQLKEVESYEALKALFEEADRRYNSGLFDATDDQLARGIGIGAGALISIFEELYLPQSPFDFSVVETQVLGQIYERFLGRRVRLGEDRSVAVEEKPEVSASAGVVPTPPYVAREVTGRTLGPLLEGKSPEELAGFRVCDVCCGSGTFLLAAYEELINHYREWYLRDGSAEHSGKVYESAGGTWHLALREKQRILLRHIYGVDKDAQATEVARLSLLLKTTENETPEAVEAALRESSKGALPDLRDNVRRGNSLLGPSYFDFDEDALADAEAFEELQPFDWQSQFSDVMSAGGFDAIVGNPPYVRIQNMVEYAPREIAYYQSSDAPYTTARKNNVDAYFAFVERALSLLKPEGRLGYILPHKFFTTDAGKALRKLLAEGGHLREITHFGTEQIFSERATYTAILVLGKEEAERFTFERVSDLAAWRAGRRTEPVTYPMESYDKEKWGFVNRTAADLFEHARAQASYRLDEVADIFVGLQTSADSVFIFERAERDQGAVHFEKAGKKWEVEPDLLVPCLKDARLDLFGTPSANALMIFPYRFEESRNAVEIEEDEMEKRFPKTLAYLRAHREKLEDRSIGGGNSDVWYRFGRRQSLRRFTGAPKLVWPVLGTEPKYSYDDTGVRFTGGGNGPYYGLRAKPEAPVSLYYLLGLLSHPLLEAMVRARASAFRGDYYSHGKTYLRHLPIRVPRAANSPEEGGDDPEENENTRLQERVARYTRSLVELTGQRQKASTTHRRETLSRQIAQTKSRMHGLIDDLYGLDSGEYEEAVAFDRLFAVGASGATGESS